MSTVKVHQQILRWACIVRSGGISSVECEAASKISFLLPVSCSISHSVCHANSVMLHFYSIFQQNV